MKLGFSALALAVLLLVAPMEANAAIGNNELRAINFE